MGHSFFGQRWTHDMALLEVRGLTKRFGGFTAIDKLDLDVHKGEILGMIGPNGAGKTTLLNVISGVLQPDEGTVVCDGSDITGFKPHRVVEKGLVRTFQATTLYKARFTVFDNLKMGCYFSSGISLWDVFFRIGLNRRNEQAIEEKAIEILSTIEMLDRKDQLMSTLSHGWQKSLQLWRCLGDGATNDAAGRTGSRLESTASEQHHCPHQENTGLRGYRVCD